MESRFTGRAHVYGDDIDTDRIIPGKYTKTLDTSRTWPTTCSRISTSDFRSDAAPRAMCSWRAQLRLRLVARAGAAGAQGAGVSAVVANYFARIFFSNAINIGLPVLEVPDLEADSGDELEIDLKAGVVKNLTKNTEYRASAMPQVMIDILDQGGLVAYLKKNGTYDASAL